MANLASVSSNNMSLLLLRARPPLPCAALSPPLPLHSPPPYPLFPPSPLHRRHHCRRHQLVAATRPPNANSLLFEDVPIQVDQHVAKKMEEWILEIKKIFQSLNLGEVSVSPYDTAWVAMIRASNGTKTPQFPKCLDWIIENQLQDGSWGDNKFFLAYDRVFNTIACMVALKTWNIGHANIQKGASTTDDGTQSNKIDEKVEGLHSITQKSKVLGSLYLFERSGDKLLLESSTCNTDLQLVLGDILLDEYGSMKSKE